MNFLGVLRKNFLRKKSPYSGPLGLGVFCGAMAIAAIENRKRRSRAIISKSRKFRKFKKILGDFPFHFQKKCEYIYDKVIF